MCVLWGKGGGGGWSSGGRDTCFQFKVSVCESNESTLENRENRN